MNKAVNEALANLQRSLGSALSMIRLIESTPLRLPIREYSEPYLEFNTWVSTVFMHNVMSGIQSKPPGIPKKEKQEDKNTIETNSYMT